MKYLGILILLFSLNLQAQVVGSGGGPDITDGEENCRDLMHSIITTYYGLYDKSKKTPIQGGHRSYKKQDMDNFIKFLDSSVIEMQKSYLSIVNEQNIFEECGKDQKHLPQNKRKYGKHHFLINEMTRYFFKYDEGFRCFPKSQDELETYIKVLRAIDEVEKHKK